MDLLSETGPDIDDDDQRKIEEDVGVGDEKEFCLNCAHLPCLCDLLKLELKIMELEKNPLKEIEDLEHGRKEDEMKEEVNGRSKSEKKEEEEPKIGNIIKGGVPKGPFLPQQKPLLAIFWKGTHQ